MKNNKQKIILAGAFVALLLFGVTFAAADRGLNHDGWSEDQRQEMRVAIESGDYESWKALITSQLSEDMFERIRLRHAMMQEHKERVEAAFDAEDYDAWVAAVSANGREPAVLAYITEENFPTLVELHEARVSGDRETARELAEELGLNRDMGRGKAGKMHRL